MAEVRGLTLEKVADRLDMTPGHISMLERGQRGYAGDPGSGRFRLADRRGKPVDARTRPIPTRSGRYGIRPSPANAGKS